MIEICSLSHLRRLSLLASGAALAITVGMTPALSLDSGWAETEGGRMRLVVDPVPRDDGTIGGILDVALEPGWKTYWRDPGSAGIPPMLDFSQSTGISLEAMHYPPPVRVDDGYAIWAGYTAPVQFPLTFKRSATGDAHIQVSAFIGICEKMCVPFQGEFEIDLPAEVTATIGTDAIIKQAFDRLPEPAGADFNIQSVTFDADTRQLEISANLPAFRPSGVKPELFVAGPQGFGFAPPKFISEENGQIHWTVRSEGIPSNTTAGAAQTLDIVVTMGQRAMQQSVQVSGFARD